MKRITVLILLMVLPTIYARAADKFDKLMKAGKAEFQKDFYHQDYSAAVRNFEKAVKLRPKDPEAHYFLGVAYSRLNSKDGETMMNVGLPLTLKGSKELETVIKLSPKYSGEAIIQDPYGKLSSDWGSLALAYFYNNKPDSAAWAFKEGRMRGGYSDFTLAVNRKVLDQCGKNSILVSCGDAYSFPLWYLQTVEGYRTDVTVVDANLLNTFWYPRLLLREGKVKFDLPAAEIEKIDYCLWRDSVVSIGDFSWLVKASLDLKYLLRGDRLLISMLRANNFQRQVYFTAEFPLAQTVSLNNYITSIGLVNRLDVNTQAPQDYESYKKEIADILPTLQKINQNNVQDLNFVDVIRCDILLKLANLVDSNQNREAKELLSLMDKYIDAGKYPYREIEWQELADDLRGRLQ